MTKDTHKHPDWQQIIPAKTYVLIWESHVKKMRARKEKGQQNKKSRQSVSMSNLADRMMLRVQI